MKTNHIFFSPSNLLVAMRDEFLAGYNQLKPTLLCKASFDNCHLFESESESCSVMSDPLRPHGLQSPWNSPGQNTGVGSLSHLQWIFPTQELNPGLLALQADSLSNELSGKPFPIWELSSISFLLLNYSLVLQEQLHQWFCQNMLKGGKCIQSAKFKKRFIFCLHLD